MAVHFIKQGDNARPLAFTLTLNGSPIDLTGASVQFKMENIGGGTPLIKAATIVGSPSSGTVQVKLMAGDTVNPGSYQIENQITFSDGSILTVPDDTYDFLTIVQNLG